MRKALQSMVIGILGSAISIKLILHGDYLLSILNVILQCYFFYYYVIKGYTTMEIGNRVLFIDDELDKRLKEAKEKRQGQMFNLDSNKIKKWIKK